MILKRIYNDSLAQASYIVGCPACGEAIVIDPNRDVDDYIRAAAEDGLKIAAVTETHIHADYLSGARELAQRTGATLYLSDEGTEDWKYAFANEPNVRLIRDGDSIKIGSARLDVVKTRGHTPEHVSFLITDEASSSEPLGMFSGDFIFVGDVGRPDLLENAAGVAGSAEPGARDLYRSIQQILKLPEHLVIWPGHGAGSPCGKALGGVPVTSLGYEKRANWALKVADEAQFVSKVLDGQPDPPKYFAVMKRLNKVGPPILGKRAAPAKLASVPTGAILVDTRPSPAYLERHVKGSLHVELDKSFIKWAGWLIPYGQDIVLLCADQQAAERGMRELSMIGLDQMVGWVGPDIIDHAETASAEEICAREVDESRGDAVLLDVRNADELASGRIEGSIHIPLGRLDDRTNEVPKGKRVIAYCSGGGRSPMAVSVLERHGYENLAHIADGYAAYRCR